MFYPRISSHVNVTLYTLFHPLLLECVRLACTSCVAHTYKNWSRAGNKQKIAAKDTTMYCVKVISLRQLLVLSGSSQHILGEERTRGSFFCICFDCGVSKFKELGGGWPIPSRSAKNFSSFSLDLPVLGLHFCMKRKRSFPK